MRFAVTGHDPRFDALRALLQADGHTLSAPGEAQAIIPPPWEEGAFYTRSETYRIQNAALTARGAAELLARRRALAGARVLLLGYGRVGRLTARELLGRGARMEVCARSREQRAWAEAEGAAALPFSLLPEALERAEIVVNTVPERVLPAELMEKTAPEALLLELASAPGGIDETAARRLGREYVRAGGLPGRVDPEKAAAILRDAVYEILAQPRPRLGVAVTGSHCTFESALRALETLKRDWELVPILSPAAATADTRFMPASELRARLEALCGKKAVDSIPGAEPLGTSQSLAALLVLPCTGNTLGKLASGITDTAVTMACKAHLRNARPLVLAISTNDGLSGSAESIARLLQRKQVYFVPFRQDAPQEKPFSLQSDFALIGETLREAAEGRQIQPVILG